MCVKKVRKNKENAKNAFTSVKQGDVFQPRKKNISGMSRAALKDLTSQIMLGRTIIQLTLRMQLSLTKATIACENS